MNTRLRGAAVVGALLLTVVLTGCGEDGTAPSVATPSVATPSGASPGGPTSSQASRAGDVMFAQMMIPHHQQAVELSDLALERTENQDLRELATQIKGAQDPEIRTMEGWLADWGVPVMDHSGHDMSGMPGMSGMLSPKELEELAGLRGTAFDTRWMEGMIAHHEGALEMAESVLGTTADPAVRELAQAIIKGQTQEIATMDELLKELASS